MIDPLEQDVEYMHGGWIGVDLDATLAKYDGWNGGEIGEPIEPMMQRVQYWLAGGTEVRIMTARADRPEQVTKVQDWLESHGLPRLAVTNKKDFKMIELWDDRAVTVEPNTGRLLVSRR